MRKIAYSCMILMLVLVVAGCASGAMAPAQEDTVIVEKAVEVEQEEMEVPGEPAQEGGRAGNYADVERLIIRNAALDLVVPDTEEAVDEISDLVDELDGYIVESNTYKYDEGLRAHLSLRVPAESLDSALEQIRDLATDVRRENISGQDVTEEYVDLQSNLRHLEATEDRLLEFLEEAEDTEAALEVYDRLQNIQAEIERVKGRMQYLKQSAAMATIMLDITPDALAQPIQVGGWHPEGTLRNAFESLIKVLQFLVDALIVIVVLIAPVLLIIAAPIVGLFFLARATVRRRKARKEKTE